MSKYTVIERESWRDDFFEGDDEVIAVFDFDYERIKSFTTELAVVHLLFPPALIASSLCCYPCFLTSNIKWSSEAQHLALTQDGIRYVVDRHPTLCGCACSDKGKVSKTVPYDKITDCDVEEPAGNACVCCVKRVLSTVNVDTASSGFVTSAESGAIKHELTLAGLAKPDEFKKAVWAMKRGEPIAGYPVPETMYRGKDLTDAGLGKRALAYDELKAARVDLDDLTKTDFLIAGEDYASTLLEATNLARANILSQPEFDHFLHRLKHKLKSELAAK